MLANSSIEPALAAELGALPFFQTHTWAMFSNDPVCGWLVNFERRWQSTLADLSRLEGVSSDDLVHYECAVPSQIMALVRWAEGFGDPARCPRITLNVNEHSGVVPSRRADGTIDWHLADPQTMLYRYAGLALREPLARRFRFVAFHETTAQVYASLLGHPVEVLPLPLDASTSRRQRTADGILTLGFLGAQRENKGFQMVPEICTLLLSAHRNIRIVVQNSWKHMAQHMQKLREIEGRDNRLQLMEEDLTADRWTALLDKLDIIVIPYDQAAYASALSGVSMEAIMNAIPQAVPRHTVIENMLAAFGLPGVVFERSEPAQVVEAVGRLIEAYPHYAVLARQGSELWIAHNGAEICTRALLADFRPQFLEGC